MTKVADIAFGYVLMHTMGGLPNFQVYAETFASSRHECWFKWCGIEGDEGLMEFNRRRREWKKKGVHCEPVTRKFEWGGL